MQSPTQRQEVLQLLVTVVVLEQTMLGYASRDKQGLPGLCTISLWHK